MKKTMAIVRVIARAEAREGKSDDLKSLLRKMVTPTRAEQGCRYYELFESNLPGTFYFNELWNSQEELDAHANSAQFTEIFGKAKELLKSPLEVNLLEQAD
jgi:quinol monooxygenase YgiN